MAHSALTHIRSPLTQGHRRQRQPRAWGLEALSSWTLPQQLRLDAGHLSALACVPPHCVDNHPSDQETISPIVAALLEAHFMVSIYISLWTGKVARQRQFTLRESQAQMRSSPPAGPFRLTFPCSKWMPLCQGTTWCKYPSSVTTGNRLICQR